jgi:RES domain-containing protein
MVYASHAYEGALLEQLVHGGIGRLPSERMASRIIIPDDCEVPRLDLEENTDWRDEMRSREIGEAWVESERSLALVVPSFVARPWGRNVLINPLHPEFGRVSVTEVADVVWDPRVV